MPNHHGNAANPRSHCLLSVLHGIHLFIPPARFLTQHRRRLHLPGVDRQRDRERERETKRERERGGRERERERIGRRVRCLPKRGYYLIYSEPLLKVSQSRFTFGWEAIAITFTFLQFPKELLKRLEIQAPASHIDRSARQRFSFETAT